MKLKGRYDGTVTYDVGDVVLHAEDNCVYHLQNPALAGTVPIDTRYWGKADQRTAESVRLIIDMQDMIMAALPDEIEDGIDDALGKDGAITTAISGAITAGLAEGGDIAEAISSAAAAVAETIPDNISHEAITLSTETADYLITVDDSGETPDLAVTEIEEENEGEGE